MRLLVCVLLLPLWFSSQTRVLLRTEKNSSLVEIKWYTPEITSEQGFNVYREQSVDGAWIKLNPVPLRIAALGISHSELKSDPELAKYIEMAGAAKKPEGLARLAVLVKSFTSRSFSRYLGICYQDREAIRGKVCRYKITQLQADGEHEIGFSGQATPGQRTELHSPDSVSFYVDGNRVHFRWKPEPEKFFGVRIFRSYGDSAARLITLQPVMLSKVKDQHGREAFGDKFFTDGGLTPGVRYRYFFEAAGFFGDVSAHSAMVIVQLADRTAPAAPDSVHISFEKEKVNLRWTGSKTERDIAGYNIYRTSKSDKDFEKLNKDLLPASQQMYIDAEVSSGSYFYRVASVDIAGNESQNSGRLFIVRDNQAPGTPKEISILADTGRIRITWKPVAENDLKGYIVYRAIDTRDATYMKMTREPLAQCVFVDSLSRILRNRFWYKIVSIDQANNKSAYSDPVSAKLPDVTAPSPPFLKSAFRVEQPKSTYVLLEWFQNPEPDLKYYDVYRKNLNDTLPFRKVNPSQLPVGSGSFDDRKVETGGSYIYRLNCADSAGNLSRPSNTLIVKIPEVKSIDIVFRRLEGKYEHRKNIISLHWNANDVSDFKGFVVYRENSGDLLPLSGITKEKKYEDQDIRPGMKYTYQVRAYNLVGDVFRSSRYSIEVPVKN
jgi:fibronectin type 3 domain-containing protein